MSLLLTLSVLSFFALSLQQQLCGTEDMAAGAACSDSYDACVRDALANRDKYANTCHCYIAYIKCATLIACIQTTSVYTSYLDSCKKFCAPCDTNATTMATTAQTTGTTKPGDTTIASSIAASSVADSSAAVNGTTTSTADTSAGVSLSLGAIAGIAIAIAYVMA